MEVKLPAPWRVLRIETLFIVAVSVAKFCVTAAGGTKRMSMMRLESTSKHSSTIGFGVTHSTIVTCAFLLPPPAIQAVFSPTLAAHITFKHVKLREKDS